MIFEIFLINLNQGQYKLINLEKLDQFLSKAHMIRSMFCFAICPANSHQEITVDPYRLFNNSVKLLQNLILFSMST